MSQAAHERAGDIDDSIINMSPDLAPEPNATVDGSAAFTAEFNPLGTPRNKPPSLADTQAAEIRL